MERPSSLSSPMLEDIRGSPVWVISGGKICAICITNNHLTALACGHRFCPECLGQFNDEFDTEKRCPVCLHKRMQASQAATFDFLGDNSATTIDLHSLWHEQRQKMQRSLKGQPLICTGCQERAAQVLKNQTDPYAAGETKDHTCLYELQTPSLEEIDAAKKASFQRACARRKFFL